MTTPYQDEVTYGMHTISFRVVPTGRTTLGISVHPNGMVEVRAPFECDVDVIRERVQRRARWITKQQRNFESFVRPLPEKEYVAGETHRYLGSQYRLKINDVGLEDDETVKLIGRFFEVYTTRPDDPAHTHRLLDRWYTEKAQHHLRHRFEVGVSQMQRYGVDNPNLVVRAMNRRWGSCTASRRITLNRWLVLAPTYCIDYVVIHELCHLVHPHHDRAFYHLLDRVLPDWRLRKERLKNVQ